MINFIWGLPGSGKSTIGLLLSEGLHLPFYEMDDYLPDELKEKMRSGNLITEEERDEFFESLASRMRQLNNDGDIVFSGYVAKKKHRDMIRGIGDVTFFELVVNKDILKERLRNRKGHFFKEETLEKIFNSFEPLDNSIRIDAERTTDEVVEQIVNNLKTRQN